MMGVVGVILAVTLVVFIASKLPPKVLEEIKDMISATGIIVLALLLGLLL